MARIGAFRSPESFEAERVTRAMVRGYLEARGFTHLREDNKSFGATVQQIVHARSAQGEPIAAHVRLCWHKAGDDPGQACYSATQILSKVPDGDWIGALEAKVTRDRGKGATHTLVVQRVGDEITDAVLIPLGELVAVWTAQRDLSDRLIAQGRFGRKRKNHAMNGSSPTLWLHDAAAPELRRMLLTWPGVVSLGSLEVAVVDHDDTLDDLPGVDPAAIGRDGAARTQTTRSAVKRDPKVRAAVIARAKGRCERASCGATRDFAGFLDVHHIFGVEASDRVYTCVALCPNCHREAHFSQEAERINEELAKFASGFGC